ncbi:tubulin--tyrosine ligase-like protein 12 [Dorcoceras hygrometricum]|uniref:Tubulin--tyrosine ligase-like protein 12 n=1 Tax=Dorcoceras hygrometricum TaxID=472368 RepID=A0A2Z6ZSY4_9LAMI|nr:tubulin--tyrosine ligase-like protein 12 [Dorcoceras hygrometricum]
MAGRWSAQEHRVAWRTIAAGVHNLLRMKCDAVEAMHAAGSTLGARARRDVARLPPRVFSCGGGAAAGRCSGESPAMS